MIQMQKSWTVRVTTKAAAFDQRVIVRHADGTEDVHPGVVGTTFTVNDTTWGIRIEHNPGTGVWKASSDRIQFPSSTGTQFEFNIRSDDSGGDGDYNDLVLTCTTATSPGEHVVYGHASMYWGKCLINPCGKPYLVIDTLPQLKELLTNPILSDAIRREYPTLDRMTLDEASFRPKVVPVRAAGTESVGPTPRPRLNRLSTLTTSAVSLHLKPKLFDIADSLFKFKCNSEALAGYALRFIEYDRTSSELAGGAYTGDGNREVLGTTTTDENGNYIFRFTRSFGEAGNESFVDTAPGEDPAVQAFPDLIVQIVDATNPDGFSFETAPARNISQLRRINLCVPKSKIPGGVVPSTGELIELVGNINILPAAGRLSAEGRVSTPSPAQGGEPGGIECAAWHGGLRIRGEIGNHANEVYTVRYRPAGATDWTFHTTNETRFRVAYEKIGPFFDRTLQVPDQGSINAPYYKSTEDPAQGFLFSDRPLKAVLHTGSWGLAPGPIDIRVDAYNAAGTSVKNATVRLYVDNTTPTVAIHSIELGGSPVSISGSDCTLLAVGENSFATLEVAFVAKQDQGFTGHYHLSVSRCNEGAEYPTNHVGGTAKPSGSYVHNAAACDTNPFRGTPDDVPFSDINGNVETQLNPVNPWLGATEPFTIIRVGLYITKRATDGQDGGIHHYYGSTKVFGIQK